MAEDVKVKFGGDFTGIAQGAASAGKIAGTAISSSFHEYTKGLTSSIANMFSVTNIMGKVFEGMKAASEYFVEIDNLSRQLNVSRSDLQKFGKIGAEVGISMETMGRSLQFANKTIGAAMLSAGAQRKTLVDLGFTEKEITSGRVKSLDVMMKIAGQYDKQINSNIIAKQTTEMFGRSGGQLTRVLKEGTEALKERIDMMNVFSDAEVKAAVAADKAMQNAEKAIKEFYRRLEAGKGELWIRTIVSSKYEDALKSKFGGMATWWSPSPEDVAKKPGALGEMAKQMSKDLSKWKVGNETAANELVRMVEDDSKLSEDEKYMMTMIAGQLRYLDAKTKAAESKGPQLETAVVSSLQSIGGGDLARVTTGLSADSIEDNTRRTAEAVEKIAGKNDTPEIPQKDLNKAR